MLGVFRAGDVAYFGSYQPQTTWQMCPPLKNCFSSLSHLAFSPFHCHFLFLVFRPWFEHISTKLYGDMYVCQHMSAKLYVLVEGSGVSLFWKWTKCLLFTSPKWDILTFVLTTCPLSTYVFISLSVNLGLELMGQMEAMYESFLLLLFSRSC